jgi:hypothetical protein
MGGVKRGKPPASARIPQPRTLDAHGLSFSFKYLDLHGSKDFSLDHASAGYTLTFLDRLRDLSSMRKEEFMRNHSLRSHVIDWEKTSRPEGFTQLNPQLKDLPAWQFQLTSNEHGRVHGFFIDDTFFIVWLDPAHNLYP